MSSSLEKGPIPGLTNQELRDMIASVAGVIPPKVIIEVVNDLSQAAAHFRDALAREGNTPEEIKESFRMAMDFAPELLRKRFEWEAENNTTSFPEVS